MISTAAKTAFHRILRADHVVAPEQAEPPVHFHAGPQGQPTPCFERGCSSPPLSV